MKILETLEQLWSSFRIISLCVIIIAIIGIIVDLITGNGLIGLYTVSCLIILWGLYGTYLSLKGK